MFFHYNFNNHKKTIVEGYDTLVIGGGGFKGSQFLGVLDYLDKNHFLMPVKYYFGTSVGSIICLMLILGFSPKEQLEIVRNLKVFSIKPLSEIKNSSPFNLEIQKILLQYIDVDLTFQQLYENTGKHLNLISFNCSQRREEIFGLEKTPNYSIYRAMCFGFTLPILFELPKSDEGDYYMDGGIINNLAVDAAVNFEKSKRILVLRLLEQHQFTSNSYLDMLNFLYSIPSQKLDELRLQNASKSEKMVKCITCTSSHGLFGLISMNKDEIDNQFKKGFELISDMDLV
jgi:predicted acylesterase/phospholipase RssA